MTKRNVNPNEITAAAPVRGAIGGVLMGLANLVPGISGGTMLLAAGVYPQFINGIAELSTFKFRLRTLILIGSIVIAAIAAIVLLAGPISELVVHHRWIMYCIFIGLTLGGAPLLWKMIKPADATVFIMAALGIALMAAMALIEPGDPSAADPNSHPYAMYLLAGIAGASAMVLPGVSGGYLLLILGQYVTILAAVATLKDGMQARDMSIASPALHVIIPVAIGVVVGVVGVSNLVKILLDKFERATLGFLLGLLLGAVIGLWPFQEGVAPEVGSAFKGDVVALIDDQLVLEKTGREIEARDFPTDFFTPSAMQIAGAIGLIVLSFLASWGIARIGGGSDSHSE